MPTAPELLHAGGNEGIIEVLFEIEPEDPAEADGHIAVAREIEIDLERVGQ